MKVLSVVGARPQFVKLAPIAHEFARRGIEHVIVHTGQHHDPLLSQVFFSDLDIPAPDVHLGVGSGSHGQQTGAILAAMDEALLTHQPDCVLVYGDTNSTLAGALSAIKLQIPVAHLEAGLRSFNREMPEEHNRVLTDHCADILLCPTEVARQHLINEGLGERAQVVGDVMTDVLFATRDAVAQDANPLAQLPDFVEGGYHLATIHRPYNTDDPQRLQAIFDSFAQLAEPVYVLAHPRLRVRAQDLNLSLERPGVHILDPLGYPQLVRAALGAKSIVTDSGGLQKEAFLLRVPTTTIRTETEWVETVQLGWNQLVEPGPQVVEAVRRPAPAATSAAPYGNGDAAAQVAQALLDRYGN